MTGPSITTLKRQSDGTIMAGDSEVKRPRLSDGSVTPHSPSLTSSSSSHPSTPTQLYKQPTHSQRSPVIKFIPYNPGQLKNYYALIYTYTVLYRLVMSENE